ncbi:IclR family transcriptional regulator (plasmid) [Agrobacterium tumefaciens]|uniref:IclR family transcriptional regulator n=1 Tax=Agrobacterium tumefaciens TaxID=358 RepID=A0AAJ4TDL2_AGRTU|nr:IclR family transcriptional regulator [Agrobacterium tumefaciens]
MNEKKVEGAQVIGKAIAMVKYVSFAGPDGAKVKDIASELGMSVPTVYRIAKAFEKNGWLERLDNKMSLRLGIELFEIGIKAADAAGIRSLARSSLLRLSEEVGATVFLMCRNDMRVIVVDRVWVGQNLSTLTDNVGSTMPMGIGAGSIAILSCVPPDEAHLVIEANGSAYAEFGVDPAEVRVEIEAARGDGYAETHDTLKIGLSAVAMPIRSPNGSSATAVTVNLQTESLTAARKARIVDLLKMEVDRIEKAIRA